MCIRDRWDTTGATGRLSVALVSMQPNLNADVNRQAMINAVKTAAASQPDLRLVTFGETSLGWYWKAFDPLYQWTVAEPLDGTTVTQMKQLAIEHGVYIAFGFTESDDGKIYDAAVIIDDAGEVVAHRRKSNFVPMDNLSGFTPGRKQLTTAFIDGIKVALLICADYNEESYQEEIANSPDIKAVVLPQASAGLEPDTVRHSPYAYLGRWLIAPQRFGEEAGNTYHGSWLLDPNGYMVSSVSEAGTAFYELRVK